MAELIKTKEAVKKTIERKEINDRDRTEKTNLQTRMVLTS